ncbi:MAG: hypothetical protein M3O90_02895 [Actinomycetota bacterium]|nr:hypothetical protein [Actinomycetota bacterium]
MSTLTLALVMGDADLVRALGIAGIPSACFGVPDESARFSRHARVMLPSIVDKGASRRSLSGMECRFRARVGCLPSPGSARLTSTSPSRWL